ncbi:hypothetical protein [Streptomyces avermitilis]|uniref:hypothetical protein n=1 Tax=Streptomyces avermitilis TaxID=33903 RepID=UPI003817EAA5
MSVLTRLGEDYLHVATAGRAVIAKHRRAPRGADHPRRRTRHCSRTRSFGVVHGPGTLQERGATAAVGGGLGEAERLRGQQAATNPAERVVIDLSHYAAVADQLRHVPGW